MFTCTELCERSQPKQSKYCMIPYDILEKQNYEDSEKSSGCQGWGEGKHKLDRHKGFLGQ